MTIQNNEFDEAATETSEVNERFGAILLDVYKNISSKHYDLALSILDNFYLENYHKDTNSNLQMECNSWRAKIFEEQRKFDAALILYRGILATMQPHDQFFIALSLDVARVLYRMGQYEEASKEIENTLRIQVNGDMFDLLRILEEYVEALNGANQSLPIHHRHLVETIASNFSRDLSEFDLSQAGVLNNAVIEMAQSHRDANQRYGNLIVSLRQIEDLDVVISSMRNYILEEKFEYYRNMAIEQLNDAIEELNEEELSEHN